jgi:2-hydroxy-6-oxo-6-(2'-carboxyphenyl)-hexa-2,4-dienoate hydrolase
MEETDDRFADVPDHGGVRGFEPAFLEADGLRTRYYEVGEGEPLVLLHGGLWNGSSSANDWAPAFDPLGERFHTLAFDRVGCGLTDNPDAVEDYCFRTELDHALAVVDALGIEEYHLCGTSRGAGLAAWLAVEYPERVRTLTLTNSHTLGPKSGDRAHRSDRLLKPDGVEYGSTDPEWYRFQHEQFSHRTGHVTEEFCRTAAALRSRPKAETTAEMMAEHGEAFEEGVAERMVETRRRLRAGAFEKPALYVYGHNDMTVPFRTAVGAFELLGQANPRARLEVLDRCGHMPFREYPGEFAGRLRAFVDREAGEGTGSDASGTAATACGPRGGAREGD